jgi:hypothetical protein
MTEEIKTQFTALVVDIIDISEKCSKLSTKDVDTIMTNVISLSKKNMLLKGIYDLESNIAKFRVAITKANLTSGIASGGAGSTEADTDPIVQPVEVSDEKNKKSGGAVGGGKKKKEEKPVEVEAAPVAVVPAPAPAPATPVTKSSKKVKEEKPVEVEVAPAKASKKKEEKPVEVEAAALPATKSSKKAKEEKPVEVEAVTPPTDEAIPEEKETPDETTTDQPLHLKRKKIPKHIKTYVWNEYIGPDFTFGRCLCCKKEKIEYRNFHCGHVIAESKGGDLTIKNLRPICAACNLSMGTMSMNEFTKTFFGWEV